MGGGLAATEATHRRRRGPPDHPAGAATAAGETAQPAKPSTPRQPRPRLDAAQWLADRLAAGPVLKSVLVADGAKAGLSASTLERAARRLGVVSERLPGRRGPVLWSLPDAGVIDAVPMSEGTAG